ncbi:MAG: peptidoglycan-binding protein [Bradyrhizobium sp.]|uniref:peptidoglycan-binding protein n=1 Tax=Bradyrhizobium sp. TaxID=376 RepID=UPI003533D924
MANDFRSLKAEYADLWQRMQIRPEHAPEVNAIAARLIALKPRYQQVAATTRVPWFIIAVLHQREASADFSGVLHNGERIIGTGRLTRLVPANRGPFSTWEESAVDALTMPPHKLHEVDSWTAERACYEIERYNGFGYRNNHPEVKSPYLWSFSTNYSSGKYVADGKFSSGAVDKQCGTMPILKRMMELDDSVRLDGTPPGPVAQPVVVAALQIGSIGPEVRQLQTALVGQGFPVGEIDGEFGPNTEAALKSFQLSRNLPPSGAADQVTLRALGGAPGEPSGKLQPAEILATLLGVLKRRDAAAATAAPPAADNPLQVILGALLGRRTGAEAANAPILSPIDNILGGEALAGKKTALSVVAYVVLSLLKVGGVVGAATPAGQIMTILIAAFGTLGGVAKVDRVIQSLGVIAAKPK